MNNGRAKYMSNRDRPYKLIFSNPDIVKDLIINYYNADWAAKYSASRKSTRPRKK